MKVNKKIFLHFKTISMLQNCNYSTNFISQKSISTKRLILSIIEFFTKFFPLIQ
jgi:hypothetical protein